MQLPEYKKVLFGQVAPDRWNQWVGAMKNANYNHTWEMIDHVEKLAEVQKNETYAIVDSHHNPLALCPLAVSSFQDGTPTALSFGYFPCATPAISVADRRIKRALQDEAMRHAIQLAQSVGAKRFYASWHPLHQTSVRDGSFLDSAFESMRYQFIPSVTNTLVIDLQLSETELQARVSKYQWRHISRGKKHGITVRVLDNTHDHETVDAVFESFKQAHFQSAGRWTRPQPTWDSMRDVIRRGAASLFVADIGGQPASYLFCGSFEKVAFGWSQVNIETFEKEYSPRHLLEWEAMMHYKRRGFYYYEIGDRYFGPDLYHLPTEKELSISLFKERYGGLLLPKIKWIGYFDQQDRLTDVEAHLRTFVSAPGVLRVPEHH